MDVRKTHRIIVQFFNAICLSAFIVWLLQAIDNYQSLATSSKVSFKYGDTGDKTVRFPSVTICQSGDFHTNEYADYDYYNGYGSNLWKNVERCGDTSTTEPPYFLTYLEDCLESGNNKTVLDLMEKVTFNVNELIGEIYTKPDNVTPLTKTSTNYWEQAFTIIHSQYHYHYGHCFTIDISSLSENKNGRYPMKYGSEKLKLNLRIKGEDALYYKAMSTYMFLHNGTNINQLGENIMGRFVFSSFKYDLSLKKVIIKSLPTRDEDCSLLDYPSCVLNTIDIETIEEHQCSLAFLSNNNQSLPGCANNITLTMIKKIKKALNQKLYKSCKDEKLCNVVNFHLSNPENAQYMDPDANTYKLLSDVSIFFEDYIVEEITDSYVYNFISIFSEVGGALGVLVGISVMTIVEFFANLHLSLRKY